MITQVMSVFDKRAGLFGRPHFTNSVGGATRAFQDEVNRKAEDNLMNRYPDDFDLYHLGQFDDETAEFQLFDRPELLISARSVHGE